MKRLLVPIFAVSLLFGCSSEEQEKKVNESKEVIGVLEEVKVVEKEVTGDGIFRSEYYVTVEKNDEKVVLRAHSEDAFRALDENTTVTIGYNEDYFIQEIKFVNMEGKKNE